MMRCLNTIPLAGRGPLATTSCLGRQRCPPSVAGAHLREAPPALLTRFLLACQLQGMPSHTTVAAEGLLTAVAAQLEQAL